MSGLRYLSTFTGIGGLDVGFDRQGLHCVGMVENDKYCMSVLNRHWPDVPKHDDVRTARQWCDERGITGNVEVVIGGAPCQDLSKAGKQAGYDGGTRSALYFDMVALAAHVGARWLAYENVLGLLTSNRGRDFAAALLALAESGFTHVEWRVLDSRRFGVPQRRKRVIVVASTADLGVGEVLTEPEGLHWHPETRFAPFADAAAEVAGGVGVGGGDDAGGRREIVGSLTAALGDKGADDNMAQAGHLIAESPAEGGGEAYRMLGFGHYRQDDTASAMKARDHKDATDLILTTTTREH